MSPHKLLFVGAAALIACALPSAGLARQAAPAAAAPPAASPPADAPGRWLRAESDHFVVYSDRLEVELRQYVTTLEDFDGILRLMLPGAGTETPRKLPVYMVKNTIQMRRAYPTAGEQLGGFYAHYGDDIFAVAMRSDANRDGGVYDGVLQHEYVHHFMLQYFPNAYPSWLVEGAAEYYALTDITPRKVVVGMPNQGRSYSLLNSRWISMSDLLGKRPSALDREQVGAFYAQSWLLTHYVWSDPGRTAKLTEYMKLLHAGEDPMTGWTKVYGDDAAGLEKILRDYLRSRLPGKGITRQPPPPPAMTVSRMPAGADDLILEIQQLKNGVDGKDAEALLSVIRAAAAKRPDERYSRVALARAECEIGDRAAGEKLLRALLVERPDDAEVLQILGFSLLAGADKDDKLSHDALKAAYKEAGRVFIKANKADPENFITLYGYARSRSLEEPSENTLEVAYRAAELAPQNPNVRFYVAQMFIQAGDYGVARSMLGPIAGDPHGGGGAKAAASLLKELEGKTDRPRPKAAAAN
ncbi:tetratricopeptide repeat protein [Caulobacter endophyticus]|uniref:DUF1570 domain-containing protein n=1 Tax=Caulobacter endophyticus TaxID=2172652 RepID=A0A2T9K289_9CAUL|nr:hypothetical protein [Caulobacter endophyticus]PVM90074.1 hypothetical protein DDF67_10720 [Caulobacter endophyticus]